MRIGHTLAASVVALAVMGAGAANAGTVNLTTYNWSYVTTSTSLADCQGYCSGYTYLADFRASGTLTVVTGQSTPLDIYGGTGSLTVTEVPNVGNEVYNYTGFFNPIALVANPNSSPLNPLATSSNSNWIWDNVLPLDSVGGPLFADAYGDQFNIWGYNNKFGSLPLPTSGVPEVVTSAAAGFSLAGTSYSSDFLDSVGTFTIAVPEPATWVMLLLGFFGVGFMMRGSSRKANAGTASS